LKEKKSISIKDPQLRIIRDNFRRTVKSACIVEQSKIHREKEKLMESNDFFVNEKYRKLSRELDDRYWAIERALRASILLCPVCFKSNRNMTYNPVQLCWFCVDCYEKLRKGNQERGTPEEFP
jgi:hypothetical protein